FLARGRFRRSARSPVRQGWGRVGPGRFARICPAQAGKVREGVRIMDKLTGQELAHLPLLKSFDLAGYRLGQPQKSGPMTVVPVFGPERGQKYGLSATGLKLSQVKGYGNLEISNLAGAGLAIVPLHMGYIQDQAQNHALC